MSKTRAFSERLPRLSPVWLVPLAALLIGLWLLFDHISSQGPEITLIVKDAEGIQAGKTAIKTHNVQIGQVQSVRLSDDYTHAVVTARLQNGTDGLLNSDTLFWVVKPRIGREGISGLGTVLSGAYIELLPGHGGDKQRKFTVSDQPPITEAGAHGLYLTLTSDPGSSVSAGDPVTYRSLTVGRVVDSKFDAKDRQVKHRIFIRKPYDVLVTSNSRFWSVTGIGFKLGAQGLRIDVQSLETLLGGGVAFGVPDSNVPAGKPVKDGTAFTLYKDESEARRGLFDKYLQYVILVQDSVRGLHSGAPVEYRGVQVGTVEQVPWHFNAAQPDLSRFAIPVLIHIEPQRLTKASDLVLKDWRDRLDRMFKRGLRASLKSANLLTGALFVDLNFHQGGPAYKPARYADVPVFPSTSSGLTQLENQVSEFLTTLNTLPLKDISDKLDRNLAASEAALKQLSDAASQLQGLLDDPATRQLPANLSATLQQLQQTLGGLAPGSKGYRSLSDTLNRLDQLVREAEPLVRTLREHPNALIFDQERPKDPIPRAAQ